MLRKEGIRQPKSKSCALVFVGTNLVILAGKEQIEAQSRCFGLHRAPLPSPQAPKRCCASCTPTPRVALRRVKLLVLRRRVPTSHPFTRQIKPINFSSNQCFYKYPSQLTRALNKRQPLSQNLLDYSLLYCPALHIAFLPISMGKPFSPIPSFTPFQPVAHISFLNLAIPSVTISAPQKAKTQPIRKKKKQQNIKNAAAPQMSGTATPEVERTKSQTITGSELGYPTWTFDKLTNHH